MPPFQYQTMYPVGDDKTQYRLLSDRHTTSASFEDNTIVKIDRDGLVLLAETAFKEIAFLLRPPHLEKMAGILNDPESSDNDKYVALEIIKNAVIAADFIFPLCQDTGTATIMGEKGHRIWTDFSDKEALSEGVYNTYQTYNLRYSQNAPLTMYEEVNTGTNLPAQIDIYATHGNEYHFLSPRAAAPPTRRSCFKKQKPY